MTLCILWEPCSFAPKALSAGAPSALLAILEEFFGAAPIVMGRSHLRMLSAMAAVAADPKPYQEMIEAIEVHSQIRLSPEY